MGEHRILPICSSVTMDTGSLPAVEHALCSSCEHCPTMEGVAMPPINVNKDLFNVHGCVPICRSEDISKELILFFFHLMDSGD